MAIDHAGSAGGVTLANNLRGKVDLVMRWPDAGTELEDEIVRLHPEPLLHHFDRRGDDSEFRPFLSRVNEANCSLFLVRQVNRTAIGYVNAKASVRLIRHQPVAAGKTKIARRRGIDHGDLVAVDLLRGEKRPGLQAHRCAGIGMGRIEQAESFRFVVR